MPTPIRAGPPTITSGGDPVIASPRDERGALFEPKAPSGWAEVFFDDFPGDALDPDNWRVIESGPSAEGNVVFDPAGIVVDDGLLLRLWKEPDGRWRGGGLTQGGFTENVLGYGDVQASIRARFPQGVGVGVRLGAIAADNEEAAAFVIVDTPDGGTRGSVRAGWRASNQAELWTSYRLDATQDHVYTVRRHGDAWHFWIDGVEQPVPPEWAAMRGPGRLTLALRAYVPPDTAVLAYGGRPNATTPSPWDAVISYVRVQAPQAITVPSEEPPPAALDADAVAAAAFLAPLRLGVNLRGGDPWRLSYDGHPLLSHAAFWGYLADLGATHVRLVYPWTPLVDYASEGYLGDTAPGTAQIARHLDMAELAIGSGLAVLLHCCETLTRRDFTLHRIAIQNHVAAFGSQASFRPALTAAKFSMGPARGYAGGTNAAFNADRMTLHNVLRSALPGHVLLTGAAQRSSVWSLIERDWLPVADNRVLAEWTAYEGGQSAELWEAIDTELRHFSARNGGVPTIGAEVGFNEAFTGANVDFNETWAANMRHQAAGIPLQRPTYYAVNAATDWWQMNLGPTDAALLPALEAQIPLSAAAIDAAVDAAATPTPVPSTPGPGAPLVIVPYAPPAPLLHDRTGTAVWDGVRIGSNVHAELLWQIVDPDTGTPRGPFLRQRLAGGWARPRPIVTQDGQFLRIAPPNFAALLDSGPVDVERYVPPVPAPSPVLPGVPVPRLDILCRGQENAVQALVGGAFGRLRDVVAHLTRIPDVRLIGRYDPSRDDNTAAPETYSILTQGRGWAKHWLSVGADAPESGWVARDPLEQSLRAVERGVSADPSHALVDFRLHWESDLGVWEEPEASRYRSGAYEIVERLRDRAGKTDGRSISVYAHCSTGAYATNRLADVGAAWKADAADPARRVFLAHGNMLDGEASVESVSGGDLARNSWSSLTRSMTRAAVNLSRICWRLGWCPDGVDLSWLPGEGPRIVSGVRDGPDVTLRVALDKGTALLPPAASFDWSLFTIDGLGAATSGSIPTADEVTMAFPGAVPANARLRYCWEPTIRPASLFAPVSNRRIIRDNWHVVRPGPSNSIPGIADYENLLQRTWAPVVIP